MSPATERLAERLVRLRDDFDRSFSVPPRTEPTELADLLAIQVAGRPHAVRLSAISALAADRPATPVPGPVPQLLGVAGFRGSVVPVYDLAALLGYTGAAAPRWLVLAAGTPALALAFDDVDGHLRVPRVALCAAGPDGGSVHAGEVVRTADGVRAVLDVAALRAEITMRSRQER